MAIHTVNCLSLCSGIGGLELGLSLVVPEFRVVCHVEREASAAALLVARMEDKSLDDAPIWDDLTTFDGAAWRGTVDIVTAGFPCQPWSVAGKRGGTDDERWIWGDIVKIIRDVQPRFVFLENVPGLLVHAGLGSVLGELAQAGFNAEWGCFTAAEVGASHRRERVFILGYTNSRNGVNDREGWNKGAVVGPANEILADAGRRPVWFNDSERRNKKPIARTNSATMADAECGRQRSSLRDNDAGEPDTLGSFPPSPNDLEGWSRVLAEMPSLEPAVCRMADGVPGRVERLRALGNAVVPLEAAYAFTALMNRKGLAR